MIHLTIDGKPVEVEKGTTILHAAKKVGITIPTLCYIEDLLPDGSCRLCVVEVKNNGRTKIDSRVKKTDTGSASVRPQHSLFLLSGQR